MKGKIIKVNKFEIKSLEAIPNNTSEIGVGFKLFNNQDEQVYIRESRRHMLNHHPDYKFIVKDVSIYHKKYSRYKWLLIQYDRQWIKEPTVKQARS